MKFLLDTNVISELRKGPRAASPVIAWAKTTAAIDLCTSVLVMAEIRRGIESKRRTDGRQAAELDRWLDDVRRRLGSRILVVDEAVADLWARLSVPDPLPLVDGLLAATAKVHGLVLVTRNTGDFRRTGIRVLDPFLTHPANPPKP